MYTNRLIFKTSTFDEVYYLKDSIFIRFNNKYNVLSNSRLNGGLKKDLEFVFNHHLSQENLDYLENHDLYDYLVDLCNIYNFNPLKSAGLVTLALMKNLSIVTKKFNNLEVTAITTAGVRVNAICAGDSASFYEEDGEFKAGTINTILLINSKLDDNVLTDAFMVASEAKSVALNNLKIHSQFSNNFATGTGTDGLLVASNFDSDNLITNASKHSKLGEIIAKSIIESIHVAIKKQVWITPSAQSNVLVRLNRYKLDINKFYDSLNQDKHTFISGLQSDSGKSENVAITTSILNLFDEVQYGLLDKNTALNLSNSILSSCDSYYVKELLKFWIDYFLK